MAKERVSMYRTVYNKDKVNTVLDTEFKTFTKPVPEVDNDTVEEFFRLYDKLFYIIPVEGENNSHQFLLKKSSELTKLEQTSEDIQPLLTEIAQLRQQLLDANKQIFELEKR